MICIDNLLEEIDHSDGMSKRFIKDELKRMKQLMKQATDILKYGRNDSIKKDVINNLEFYSK